MIVIENHDGFLRKRRQFVDKWSQSASKCRRWWGVQHSERSFSDRRAGFQQCGNDIGPEVCRGVILVIKCEPGDLASTLAILLDPAESSVRGTERPCSRIVSR
jgi:hypothetical protein